MDKKFTCVHEGQIEYPPYLPGFSYVYILYNSQEKIAYVGQSINLFGRLTQHFEKKKFGNLIKCEYFIVKSEDALIAENYFIKSLKPMFNKESLMHPKSVYIDPFYIDRKISDIQMSLREYLTVNNITIADFADKIRYARGTIQGYLLGKTRVGRKIAMIIDIETKGVVTLERVLSDNPLLISRKKPKKIEVVEIATDNRVTGADLMENYRELNEV